MAAAAAGGSISVVSTLTARTKDYTIIKEVYV